MDRHKVVGLLDISCAKALDAWWEKDIRFKVQSRAAMTALQDKLGRQKPDYDCEYVPPAYVIRYQISHILMACRNFLGLMLEKTVGRRCRPSQNFDFGAGTSAGRIGAALMARPLRRSRLDHIHFDEIDISSPMLEMGELVWQAFTQEVQRKVADSICRRGYTSLSTRDVKRGWQHSMSRIRPESDDLKKIIKKLYQRVEEHSVVTIDGRTGSCHPFLLTA